MKLKETIQNIPAFFIRGKCLGIETSTDEIRAVLVEKKGSAISVMDYVALMKTGQDDDLPSIEVLREIKERLGCSDGIRSVFVSPVARSVVIPMNTDKITIMKRHQLLEAVKWEVEPYTGISGQRAFTGVEATIPKPEPGQILEEVEETLVNVSVLEQNIYRAVRERFKMAGLKLTKVYPPEACFYVPLLFSHTESDRCVMEIGRAYATFAMLKGREPKLISTLNITTEMIRDHLDGNVIPDIEENLSFVLAQAPKPLSVVITGQGALDEDIVNFVSGLSPTGAEPLVMEKTTALTSAGQEESPIFAIAAGAGMRELSSDVLTHIGISDEVPLAIRIRKSAYLMPLVVTVFIFIGMLGHYQFMKIKDRQYRKLMDERKAAIEETKKQSEESLKIDKEIDAIDAKIKASEKRKKFATGEADLRMEMIVVFLDAIAGAMPPSVGINEILQKEDEKTKKVEPDSFYIRGTAADASSVGNFALGLYESGSFEELKVEEIIPASGDGAGSVVFKMDTVIKPVKNEKTDPA